MNLNKREDLSNLDVAVSIFHEHGDFLRCAIRFQVRDPGLANDLFQEFFLRLVNRPVPRDVEDVRGYLFRALANDIVDARRRIKRYRQGVLQYAQLRAQAKVLRKPEEPLIEAEGVDRVVAAIEEQLLPREAKAVTLRYKDEFAVEEIAQKMGVNVRSVSRYLSAGLKKLRQNMAP
jgi:RNA polymerase sigma factor (sigma-70 family)